MHKIYDNDTYRNNLKVPDGATKQTLALIAIELDDLYKEILQDLRITGSKIEKRILVS